MAWTSLPALSSQSLLSQSLSTRVFPSRNGAEFGGIERRRSPHQQRPFKFECNAVVSTPAFPPRTAKEFQEAYGRQGLRFFDVDGVVAAELRLENKSKVRLLLPKAQIASYKAHMWHGSEEEVLHCVRSGNGRFSAESLRGGIDLRFFHSQDPLSSILPSSTENWSVDEVTCEPSNYVQITLTSSSSPELRVPEEVQGSLQFRYVVTLTRNSLSTALVVTNSGVHPVEFTGSIMNHMAVSSVEGAFAVGLNGCSYLSLAPAAKPSNFFSKLWGSKKESRAATPDAAYSESTDVMPELERGRWTLENEDCSQLHGGEDRLYPTPPTSFILLDRGFRRSLMLQRIGFEEFCLSNPGPSSNLADWNDFICMGPAQSTQSVRLLGNEEWRAAQTLLNPGV